LRSKHFATAENQKRKGNKMKTTELELDRKVVSAREWEAVRQQLLVKEKELSRARDALSAERRRMPLLAVEKEYEFDGPQGRASLLDLFEGRRQLIVYRAFFEPGVVGWPEHACVGCSMVADQVAHPAHLNARDTTLAFASRAPRMRQRSAAVQVDGADSERRDHGYSCCYRDTVPVRVLIV